MNPQLSALFNAHKGAIFAAAAAGAVGLGLLTRKKSAAKSTTSAGSPSRIPGTLPAAAVVSPSSAGVYDSSSFDAYNALQPELEAILQQQNKATTDPGITTAPTPIASTLLQPTYDGNYIRTADGQIDEVESDGSLLWLNPSENAHAANALGVPQGSSSWYDQLTVKAPSAGVYNTGQTLIGKATRSA